MEKDIKEITKFLEVRWHARGGQGAVTAAKALAEAAITGGKHVQAFPEYGPERMGAPIRAYNRLSDKAIYIHGPVTKPAYVVVLDPTLIGMVDIAEGTSDDTVFIINTPKSPTEMREKLGLTGGKIYTIDASKISQESLGRPIPNTPMLGALVGLSGAIDKEALIEDIKIKFGKKFGQKIVEGNVAAVERSFHEVQSE